MSEQFSKRLFLSYAHDDDEPFMAGESGFVSRLHENLQTRLKVRGFRDIQIWMDRQKLAGNHIFAKELDGQVTTTDILISVLSPAYMASTWCVRELLEFCEAVARSEQPVVGTKARVFKIVKRPLLPEHEKILPELIRSVDGYDFYALEDNKAREFDPVFGQESKQLYAIHLDGLAEDIAIFLRELTASAAASAVAGMPSAMALSVPESATPTKPPIYLAQCAYDRQSDRAALEVELKGRGYPVFPERQLPSDEAGHVAEAAALLSQCRLSIHLVGSGPGMVPDGPSGKPAVMLQNELAAERSRTAGLKRIVWLNEGTKSDDPRQQGFLNALLNDPQVLLGADVITGNFESLKEAVRNTLRKLETPEAPQPAGGAGSAPKLVYIICCREDRTSVLPLRKYLKEAGFRTQVPVFEGDAAEVHERSQAALAECDAVMVYYGAGTEAWKRTVDSERLKIKGYRPGKPAPPSWCYVAAPVTTDKQEALELEDNPINGLEGFSEAALQPLIQSLRSGA